MKLLPLSLTRVFSRKSLDTLVRLSRVENGSKHRRLKKTTRWILRGVTRQLINAKTLLDVYGESKNGDLSAIQSVLIEKLNILNDLDERIHHLLSLDETVDE